MDKPVDNYGFTNQNLFDIMAFMDEELVDKVAKIIAPYLKTKHKEDVSYELAEKILEEIDPPVPTWYLHG